MSTTTEAPPQTQTEISQDPGGFWGTGFSPHGGTIEGESPKQQHHQQNQSAPSDSGDDEKENTQTPPSAEEEALQKEQNSGPAPSTIETGQQLIRSQLQEFSGDSSFLKGLAEDPAYKDRQADIEGLKAGLAKLTIMNMRKIQQEHGIGDQMPTEDELQQGAQNLPAEDLQGQTPESLEARLKDIQNRNPQMDAETSRHFDTLVNVAKNGPQAERQQEETVSHQTDASQNQPGGASEKSVKEKEEKDPKVGGSVYGTPETAADKIAEDTEKGPGATKEKEEEVENRKAQMRSDLREEGSTPGEYEGAVKAKYQSSAAAKNLGQNFERAGHEPKDGAGTLKAEGAAVSSNKQAKVEDAINRNIHGKAPSHEQGNADAVNEVQNAMSQPVSEKSGVRMDPMLLQLIEEGRATDVGGRLPASARAEVKASGRDFLKNVQGFDNMRSPDGPKQPTLEVGGTAKVRQTQMEGVS